MYDLRDVVVYLAQRIGLIPGRVWFGAAMAVNAALTAKQQRNFLRFLNGHGLRRYLVLDDFRRRSELTTAAAQEKPLIEPPCPASLSLQSSLHELCPLLTVSDLLNLFS